MFWLKFTFFICVALKTAKKFSLLNCRPQFTLSFYPNFNLFQCLSKTLNQKDLFFLKICLPFIFHMAHYIYILVRQPIKNVL